jgi:hypothetical protein
VPKAKAAKKRARSGSGIGLGQPVAEARETTIWPCAATEKLWTRL